ncbi:hypothetical protein LINPERPRIM_LOCUS24991 [Linum perenne]|jgi:1-acyl-sn-glycerol-3-phosphate acyltransferase
MFYP